MRSFIFVLTSFLDHILLLQNSLYHYEYILSHCQPAYLSHLNVSYAFTKGRTDQAILALSVVAISILPMQFITGGSFLVPYSHPLSSFLSLLHNLLSIRSFLHLSFFYFFLSCDLLTLAFRQQVSSQSTSMSPTMAGFIAPRTLCVNPTVLCLPSIILRRS